MGSVRQSLVDPKASNTQNAPPAASLLPCPGSGHRSLRSLPRRWPQGLPEPHHWAVVVQNPQVHEGDPAPEGHPAASQWERTLYRSLRTIQRLEQRHVQQAVQNRFLSYCSCTVVHSIGIKTACLGVGLLVQTVQISNLLKNCPFA